MKSIGLLTKSHRQLCTIGKYHSLQRREYYLCQLKTGYTPLQVFSLLLMIKQLLTWIKTPNFKSLISLTAAKLVSYKLN